MMADIIGVIGMSALVGAYFLLLFGKWKANSYRFLFSNLFGSTFLMINGLMIGAPWFYPFINLVWMVGTTYQIFKERRAKKQLSI
jgi:hypothetical protein